MIKTLHKKNTLDLNEDLLTGSIFSLLIYLPIEILWKILYESEINKQLPKYSGNLISYEFWPHWDSENTTNTNYIEPDVYMEFESLVMIIESKRYDNISQYKQQWENEIQAYKNEYDQNTKEIFLLAIGGIENNDKIEKIKEVKICKMKWGKVLNTINEILKDLHKIKTSLQHVNSTKIILEDIIDSLALFGFFTKTYLSEIKNDIVLHNNFKNSLEGIKKWKI